MNDVISLLAHALIVAQTVIEKPSLPMHRRCFRGDTFETADYVRQRFAIRLEANQSMQMIRHEQEDLNVPSLRAVVYGRSLEKRARYRRKAQLVVASLFTTNRDEIDRAETSIKMN